MNIIKIQKMKRLIESKLYDILKKDLMDTNNRLTITRVEISSNLSDAYVYILTQSCDNNKQVIDYLNLKNKKFKHLLLQKIRFNRVPNLHFYHDDDFEASFRLHDILDNVIKKND